MFCIKIQNNKDLSDSEANTKSFGLGLVRPPSVPFLFRTSGKESHSQAGLARVSVKQIERYEHTFLYCRWSRLLVFGFLCGSSLSRNIVKQCANILALFITFCKITKNHALHFHSLEDVIFVQFNWYSGPGYCTDVEKETLKIGYNGGLRSRMVFKKVLCMSFTFSWKMHCGIQGS